ncbi:hypothetical protein BOX15_Mlig031658g1 [Macrostomum lignano]|uniref:Uncharacterized protein n=1 Tax=Macrostomum lignano TaxID=282301 RepID=A0A267H796_9PLAT|nr:hypothetical protein BOX15_Mlig031658g1 [Macrostomum lignano]
MNTCFCLTSSGLLLLLLLSLTTPAHANSIVNSDSISDAELKDADDNVEQLYLDLLARRNGDIAGSPWTRRLLKRLQAAAIKKRNELPPISTLRFG